MGILDPKLGPIVFQFPFFNRSIFRDRHEFLDRLVPFLTKLPEGHRFAIEMRNRNWLNAEFADVLRDHRIALVLQDRSFMPSPAELCPLPKARAVGLAWAPLALFYPTLFILWMVECFHNAAACP